MVFDFVQVECVSWWMINFSCWSGAEEEDTEGWVVSSESCSFQSIGARYYREVLPGEIVQISKHGVKSLSVVPRPEGDLPAFCIFEYVYFARPDSIFEGIKI